MIKNHICRLCGKEWVYAIQEVVFNGEWKCFHDENTTGGSFDRAINRQQRERAADSLVKLEQKTFNS